VCVASDATSAVLVIVATTAAVGAETDAIRCCCTPTCTTPRCLHPFCGGSCRNSASKVTLQQAVMTCLICLQTSEWFFRRRVVEKTNVFFATVCLVVLTISLGILSHRLALANASGKRWCVNTCYCGLMPQQTICRSHAYRCACAYQSSQSRKHELASAMRTDRQEPPAHSDGAEGRGRAHHRGAPASAMHCPQQRVAKTAARHVCAVLGYTIALPGAVCTLQLVIVLSWFIANVYVVAGPCRWFDGFVIVNGAPPSRTAAGRLCPLLGSMCSL
jgi:hypothetical protein